MGYDAFISYSHAGDGRLAPAVQTGVQRLARPWYRLRALHVFRDETGLAVNPHLWVSIQQALDESEWFVLFCSPEAAASPWVDREVAHWLATKPAERILPVLTAGTMAWDEGTGTFTETSDVPPALRNAFTSEPRFLDLRWAHDEEQLDLRHSRFRESIAEIAAPMHGTTKDALENEDVRLHRRSRRLARAAAISLAFFALAAMVTGVLAVTNANRARAAESDARAEADRARAAERNAEQEAARARAAEQRAQDETARAQTAEQNASEQRDRAQLAEQDARDAADRADSEAENARTEAARADNEAGIARAQATRADQAAQSALTQAARADVETKNAQSQAQRADTESANARSEADNALRANAAAETSALQALDEASRADTEADRATAEAQRATTQAAEATRQRDLAQARSIAANGLARAQTIHDLDTGVLLAAEASLRSDDFQVRDAFLRALQQRPANLVRFVAFQPAGVHALTISPDGRLAATLGARSYLTRIGDGTDIPLAPVPFALANAFSADSTRLATYTGSSVVVSDTTTGATIATVPDVSVPTIALDEHGAQLLIGDPTGIAVVQLDTLLSTTLPLPSGVVPTELAISPDGARIAFAAPSPPVPPSSGSNTFDLYQIDAATGSVVTPIKTAHTGPCWCVLARDIRLRYAAAASGLTLESFATATDDDALIVWDAASMDRLVTVPSRPSTPEELEYLADVSSDKARVLAVGGIDGLVRVRDATTGALVSGPYPANLTRAIGLGSSLGGVDEARFADPLGDTVLTVGIDGKQRLWSDAVAPAATRRVRLQGQTSGFGDAQTRSGSLVAVEIITAVRLFDGLDGHLVATLSHGLSGPSRLAFSHDETQLALASQDIPETAGANEAALRIWDVASRTLTLDLPLDSGATTLLLSDDGSRVALQMFGSAGSFVQIRDTANGALVAQYGDSDHPVSNPALAPDGQTLVLGDDAVDMLTGVHVPVPAIFQRTNVPTTFSADGLRAAVTSFDGVEILDTRTGAVVATVDVTSSTSTAQLALSPDGTMLSVTYFDGTNQLFDVATGLAFGQPFEQFGGAFTTDGALLTVVYGPPGLELRRIDTTTAAFRLHTCALAHRALSSDEWARYVGDGSAPRSLCE